MADDDDLSPLPFRRERNLSNRNFNKRNSRRRLSTESRSSQHDMSSSSESSATTATTTTTTTSNVISDNSAASDTSSSFQLSYSVNSDTENAFKKRSLLKMRSLEGDEILKTMPPTMPDPALLDVRQKVQRFETLKTTITFIKSERHSLKLLPEQRQATTASANDIDKGNTVKTATDLTQLRNRTGRGFLGELRNRLSGRNSFERSSIISTSSVQQTSIDEVRSEDEVDNISDYEADPDHTTTTTTESAAGYVLPELAQELKEDNLAAVINDETTSAGPVSDTVPELGIDDFGKIEVMQRSVSVENSSTLRAEKDFMRNYRNTPRRKTEDIGTKNTILGNKFHSLYQPREEKAEDDEDEEIVLREKCDKCVEKILDELIHTEETYVESLRKGIADYGNIFQRKDLPLGLRGKKYDLFGNIEQIAEFHHDEFLPMLHRNRKDLKRLFEEFIQMIEENCFYSYVIFTMNKQKSLKLCDVYKNYFKLIQTELDDKLGINSFLVQPIQRMARYPLLLKEFINTFFKNCDVVLKPLIEVCCRLDKRFRTLLTTTNESEIVNDVIDCNEFNVFHQGKFRKVSEIHIFDHTLKRSYRAKVFIFDKCIIYTEIKGKNLIFRGRYPYEHIGFTSKNKTFTLYYQHRKQQECDFSGDAALISTWQELIREMIGNFANEERQKLQERYSHGEDHLHRKAPSLSLYRDSNRFSSDSGIGNIWVMPKPEEEPSPTKLNSNNSTTWYTTA